MILPCDIRSVDAVENYAKSEPVVVPTDTLYGLAMSIYGDVGKIYRIKGRDSGKKIPVGVYDMAMLEDIAYLGDDARKIAEHFLPGALTLVLRSRIPAVTGPTVGVRIPDHEIPRELARRIGPITLTSANKSGEKSPVRIEDTMKLDVRYRIDCGELSGVPSTVVSFVDEIRLIREGAIPFREILRVLEE